MNRIASSRSTIKLFLVIALSLALSCVTAPGIRTSDVAELHYGDREDSVVEKLGEGGEIFYFVLDRKQYRYRLYTTQYTKDVYALLFINGELVAVHDEKQDFSECLNIDASIFWEQCVSNKLSEMRHHEVSLGSHDFSHGVQTEQREQAERDRSRVSTFAVAVPLTVVLPGIVPMYCFLGCGEVCKEVDPGARPEDYQDSCINKLASTLGQAINMLHGNITYESIDKALGQIQHHKIIIYDGAIDEKTIDDNAGIWYSWGCVDSYPHLSIKLGLTDGLLKWSWFKLGADIAALKILQERAEQGDPDAQYNVFLLMKDEYMPPDEAWRWLCKAANQGHNKAQVEVAYWHNETFWEHGRPRHEWLRKAGIQADNRVAYMWYTIAENDNPNRLRTINSMFYRKLTEEEIAEADEMVRNWKQGQCPTPYQ